MGDRLAAAMLVGSILAAIPAARADDEPGEPGAAPVAPPRGDHKGQLGLAVAMSSGYRFIKTWDNDRYCGERADAGDGGGNAAYCAGHAPFALDLSLSYGVSHGVDLLLDLRFGIERDFGSDPVADGPRLRHYAPGVRFWLGHGPLAWFATAQLAIDTTAYAGAGTDVRLRNTNGLQVDFHDAYGVYAYFGEQVSFGRWLEGGAEVGAGIQGRYP